MTPYDPDNIFAKILRGEMPSHKVFDDSVAIAIMDIMPRADGHVLVVPKAPARNLLDADPKDLAAVIPRVQTIARAVKAAMQADGITVQQFNEPAGGQAVFHLHFHVLPRWTGVPLQPHMGKMENPDVLAAHAERIRAALA
jgi:histidine triad (HIT) family protein